MAGHNVQPVILMGDRITEYTETLNEIFSLIYTKSTVK